MIAFPSGIWLHIYIYYRALEHRTYSVTYWKCENRYPSDALKRITEETNPE